MMKITKKMTLCLTAAALAALFSGCASQGPQAQFKPTGIDGLLLTDYTAPLSADFVHTDIAQLKKGSAKSTNILGLIVTGDCSLTTAAKDGGLTTIEYADYKFHSILGLFSETTVNVYGK